MIRPFVASLGLHLAALGALVHSASPPSFPKSAPRPLAVELLTLPGGGKAKTSSLAPGGLPGAPRRQRKARARATQSQPPMKVSTPVDGESQTEVEVEGPEGDGAGPKGSGELGIGSLNLLVQLRVQAVADLMCGRRWTKSRTVQFDVDVRGYVANHEHKSELDQILHMAEPFPPGGPYTVTVDY